MEGSWVTCHADRNGFPLPLSERRFQVEAKRVSGRFSKQCAGRPTHTPLKPPWAEEPFLSDTLGLAPLAVNGESSRAEMLAGR